MTPPFAIGQPVICINPSWGQNPASLMKYITLPVRGRIYHIRTIEQLHARGPLAGDWSVRLDELRNQPINAKSSEPVFEARNYRPLGERKSDITFAYQILTAVAVGAPIKFPLEVTLK